MTANPQLDELTELERPYFDDFPEFEPFGSPRELLELGIFGGHYFDDMPDAIPSHWSVSECYYFGKKKPASLVSGGLIETLSHRTTRSAGSNGI